MVVLSGNGVASFVLFCSKASRLLRLVDGEEDADDVNVKKIAKHIIHESKERTPKTDSYSTQLTSSSIFTSLSYY